MDSALELPESVDGESVSPSLATLIAGVGRQLDRDPTNRLGVSGALLRLAEFLASAAGRTNANCVVTNDVFLLRFLEHPRFGELPGDIRDIVLDFGGALHDSVSAPAIAENFSCTPEQLAQRIRDLPSSASGG